MLKSREQILMQKIKKREKKKKELMLKKKQNGFEEHEDEGKYKNFTTCSSCIKALNVPETFGIPVENGVHRKRKPEETQPGKSKYIYENCRGWS